MLNKVITLALAAGFATASFAQTGSPAPAPTAKLAPAPAATEKKVEAPKAAEPVKAESTKAAAPAKMEGAKAETAKAETPASAAHPVKVKHHHAEKAPKAETKGDTPAPAAK